MAKQYIVGVQVTDRMKNAPELQKLLTKYGCNIKTRIGLHEVSGNVCASKGLVVLELIGPDKECNELIKKLGAIKGLNVKKMVFSR